MSRARAVILLAALSSAPSSVTGQAAVRGVVLTDTGSAPVEVTRCGVMDGMVMFPAVVGCKVQQRGDSPQEVIRLL